jgi:hypothetical protein
LSGDEIEVWTFTDVQMPNNSQQPDIISNIVESATNLSIIYLPEAKMGWGLIVSSLCAVRAQQVVGSGAG